jgi:predicted NodU family carbamoyl transferase
MPDGYFLSIYAHICPVAAAYALPRRHDQAMALWHLDNYELKLLRYWEFERLSGIKGHSLSFPDEAAAYAFIAEALSVEGLTLDDLNEIVGTPGLSTARQEAGDLWEVTPDVAYHSLCHLYSGMFVDSDIFYRERILCLSLDAGPDHVVDKDAWNKPHYLGAFVSQGSVSVFPVQSPALLWALMREKCSLAEGTLMALGSASLVQLDLDVPPLPDILSVEDRFAVADWIDAVARLIDEVVESHPNKFSCPQGKFTVSENKIAALVKIVQAESFNLVVRVIEQAIARFNIDPKQTYISMVGGFALNCPINAQLLKVFGFRDLISPPVVNDSGIALGMGLHHAANLSEVINFQLGSAFHGRQHSISEAFLKESPLSGSIAKIDNFSPPQVVEDILSNPIVWFNGAAEIGPRALGHRSLLADPRNLSHKARLNRIKQREWWRPVAPLVLAQDVPDWFELETPSPFMLQAVPVREERKEEIPAICHLDGTARVQSVTDKEDPLLSRMLLAFKDRTGVPILCNTSLNDKGEPIIDDPLRALTFALEKGIEIVYINGLRIQLKTSETFDGYFVSPYRPFENRYFTAPEITEDWLKQHNPHQLTRRELAAYFSNPRLAKYDLTQKEDVQRLRRLLSVAEQRRGGVFDVMLTTPGGEGLSSH